MMAWKGTIKDAEKAGGSYASQYTKLSKAKTAEDEERQARVDRQAQSDRADKAKAKESKGFISDALGFGAGVLGFGRDVAVGAAKSLGDSINTAGTGLGHAIDDVTGATEQRNKQFKQNQDDMQNQLLDNLRKSKDNNLPEDQRAKHRQSAESIASNMNQQFSTFSGGLEKKVKEVDPIKQAGATVDLATTIASLGAAGAVKSLAKSTGEQVIKTVTKDTAKQLTKKELEQQALNKAFETGSKSVVGRAAKTAAAESAAGATIGVAQTARDKGSDATLEEYAANGGLGAVIGGLAGGAVGGIAGRSARRGAIKTIDDIQTSRSVARPKDAPVPVNVPEQKLLGEPGQSYHQKELDDIQSRLDSVNNGDQKYLEDNGLIRQNKDDGRLANQLLENPEVKKSHDEATQAVVETEDQIKQYTDMKLSSPYHRQVDKVESKAAQDIEQLQRVAEDQGAHPDDVKQLTDEITANAEAEKARLADKYPEDAAEAPALDDALKNATAAHLDAQSKLQDIATTNYQTIKEAGGLLKEPDTEKLVAHKQQLEARQKEIQTNIAAAEKRATTPSVTTKDVEDEIHDLQNGTHPVAISGTNAEKKQLFKDLQRERTVATRQEAKAEAVAEPTKPLSPDTKAAVAEDAAEALQLPTKSVNSASQFFQTPTRLLRKIGLGDLSDTIEESFTGYRQSLNKVAFDLHKLADTSGVSSKSSKERVVAALEGKDDVVLSSKEQKAVDTLRSFYKDYADRLGLKEEQRIQDYFPHMYENIGNSKDKNPIPIELQNIMSKKFSAKTKAGNIDNSRLSDDDLFIKDPFKVAAAYAQQAERRIHMQPAFEQMNKYIGSSDVDGKVSDYLNNYGRYLKGDQQGIDKLVNNVADGVTGKTNSGTRALQGVRNGAYRANLQMNFGSAIRNLTQGTNTMAELGPIRSTQGFLKMSRIMAEAAKDSAKGVPNKDMDELLRNGVLDDTFHNDGELNLVKKSLEKFDKVGWAMFNATEKINRGSAYFGAKAKYLAKNKNATDEEAQKYASDVVAKTQFHFNEMETPPLLRSKTAKAGLQYQSFNIKQAEYLADMFNGSRKEIVAFAKGNPEGAANLIKAVRWTGANLAMTAAAAPLIGAKFTDMIPNPLDPRNYGSPVVQLLFGDGKGNAGFADVLTGKDVKTTYDENGEPITDPVKIRENNAASFLQKTLPAVALPWGTQAKKTVEGLDTVNRGYSQTDSGNIRFQVGKTDENRLQAGLFGQYALPEAQKFYGNDITGIPGDKGKNLSPQASDKVRQAPEGSEDQYLKFYKSASEVVGRKKANDEITRLFQDGQPEKARRKAQEFNDKVNKAMSPYFAEFKDEDPELEDELNSNLYIKLTKRGEKQRAK